MPQVSVIMAIHNEPASMVDAAVSSILAQTMSDLELILCNDGTSPETAAALTRWRERDSRVILTQSAGDAGAGAARDLALALVQSPYTAIMDADDISAPQRLALELDFLELHPDFAFVGSRGGLFRQSPGDLEGAYWFVERPAAGDFLMTLPFVHASLLFRTAALRQVGGYRTCRAVLRSEDYDLLLRLYAAGQTGANLTQTLYFIRTDEGTLQRRKYRYRFSECRVKLSGFYKLHLFPKGLAYAFKPLLVGLLPRGVLEKIKRAYYTDS